MFSGTSKSVPKTLKDCTKAEQVTNDLWYWSERIARWGQILLIALCIIGIIAAIAAGSDKAKQFREEVDNAAVFVAFITTLLPWALYAVIEFIAYKVLAVLFGAAAEIVQNTEIAANVALYTAANEKSNNTEK